MQIMLRAAETTQKKHEWSIPIGGGGEISNSLVFLFSTSDARGTNVWRAGVRLLSAPCSLITASYQKERQMRGKKTTIKQYA